MNDWLVFLAAVVCYLLLAFSVSWLIPTSWRAGKNVHIKHRWQGGAREETDVYGAGTRHPVRTVYHQWFECTECGREKLKKIGVKK